MILVTGGTGFLGKALIQRLHSDSYKVRTVARHISSARQECETLLVSDINQVTDWSAALEGVEIVVHAAARVHVMKDKSDNPLEEFRRVNVQGTLKLARQAAENGVKRFVFISSIKVNGEATTSNSPFTSQDIPAPLDPYGISKREAEDALMALARQTEMQIVIIRPPLIYGPGVKANFQLIMKWVRKGLPWPIKPDKNKRSLVYIENLTDLIVRCLYHPAAANKVFLVSDDHDMSTAEIFYRLSDAMKRKVFLFPMPPAVVKFLAMITGRKNLTQRLYGDLQVDISDTKNQLEWKPPVSIEEAFQRTVQQNQF